MKRHEHFTSVPYLERDHLGGRLRRGQPKFQPLESKMRAPTILVDSVELTPAERSILRVALTEYAKDRDRQRTLAKEAGDEKAVEFFDGYARAADDLWLRLFAAQP